MPYYDYKCLSCNEIFEIQKSMLDNSIPKCPQCGKETQRIFNVPRTLCCTKEAAATHSHTPSSGGSSCSSCSGSCAGCH